MSVRLAMAVVGLVGAVSVFARGVGGDEPHAGSLSEAQHETVCEQAALGSEQVARDYERETGRPAQGFTKDDCLGAGAQRSR